MNCLNYSGNSRFYVTQDRDGTCFKLSTGFVASGITQIDSRKNWNNTKFCDRLSNTRIHQNHRNRCCSVLLCRNSDNDTADEFHSSVPKRLQCRCRRCGLDFNPKYNHPDACSYHASIIGSPGYYNISIIEEVKVKRWSCCHSTNKHSIGCKSGRHLTYDDEDERWMPDWSLPYNGVSGYGMRPLS